MGDTTYTTTYYYELSCIEFPLNEIVYLGIKKEIRGKIHLGWIKLQLPSSGGVKIYETAIQK